MVAFCLVSWGRRGGGGSRGNGGACAGGWALVVTAIKQGGGFVAVGVDDRFEEPLLLVELFALLD